jgi:hypothetical protein
VLFTHLLKWVTVAVVLRAEKCQIFLNSWDRMGEL